MKKLIIFFLVLMLTASLSAAVSAGTITDPAISISARFQDGSECVYRRCIFLSDDPDG